MLPLEPVNHREWDQQRTELIERLEAWRGPLDERGPLEVEEHGRREYRSHTEIKLSYDDGRRKRIPAYLLIPRNAPDERLPAVFAAHQCAGHCDVGKEQVVGKCADSPDQAYGLELAREGFVVLAPDANKVGERYDPSLREPWQTMADLGGQQACCTAPGGSWGPVRAKPVFDVMRGIDLLCEHPRVNPDRIGMIGHSLGADTTLWVMPFEPRIKAAAISGGGLQLDWMPYGLPFIDILRLIAPRPFLHVCGVEDPAHWATTQAEMLDARAGGPDLSVPVNERMRASRAATEAARDVYRLYAAEDAIARYEFDGGHSFPPDARRAAYDWLRRWLGADDSDPAAQG